MPRGLLIPCWHLILTLIWEGNPYFSFKKIMFLFPFIIKYFTALGSLLFSCLLYSSLIRSFKWFNLLWVSWLYTHTIQYSFCFSWSWAARGACIGIGLWGKFSISSLFQPFTKQNLWKFTGQIVSAHLCSEEGTEVIKLIDRLTYTWMEKKKNQNFRT